MTFWPLSRPRQTELKNARATLTTLLMMASTIESRDPFTGGHLWRVSRLAEMLARRIGMGAVDIHRVAISCARTRKSVPVCWPVIRWPASRRMPCDHTTNAPMAPATRMGFAAMTFLAMRVSSPSVKPLMQ